MDPVAAKYIGAGIACIGMYPRCRLGTMKTAAVNLSAEVEMLTPFFVAS